MTRNHGDRSMLMRNTALDRSQSPSSWTHAYALYAVRFIQTSYGCRSETDLDAIYIIITMYI